jgi:hypothetical protein
MKKYYSDYIRHCTRRYFDLASAPSVLSDRVEYNNYVSVSNVISKHEVAVQNLLRYVYTSETVQTGVNTYCKQQSRKAEEIWYIIQSYEKEVAIERGLL